MAKVGRKTIAGTRTRAKKKDAKGNELKGRPSFDPIAPVSNDQQKLTSLVEELSEGSFKAPFNRSALPELYREIADPREALKAYVAHHVLALTPKQQMFIYLARVCNQRNILDSLYSQVLLEMTFDFRAQDKNQLEGYFKNILETGMHIAMSKGDMKSFFAGAKLMKDLFGIETRKVIRAEVSGKSVKEIFSREFVDICNSTEDEELDEEDGE